jgi:hypothetical protein
MPPEKITNGDYLAKKLGLPSKVGTVVNLESKYYFVAGSRKTLLPASFIAEEKLAKMVGTKVQIITSGKNIVAIIPIVDFGKPWRPHCFMCYVPVRDFAKQIDWAIQKDLAKKYLDKGVLNAAQFNVINEQINTLMK